MAHTHIHTAPGALSGESSLLGRIGRFLARLSEYRRLAHAERELNSLDDRMLADIGINRSQIHERVWGHRNFG